MSPQYAEKIAALRKKAGLTQEQLAEKAEIDVRTVQRAESGQVIRSASLRRMANVFGVSFSELAHDVTEPLPLLDDVGELGTCQRL